MADAKISALTSLASVHATGDLLPIVDVSDTTQAASGTTKQTTLANLLANLPGPTNAVGISYTGQSLTGSNASTLLNLATTWNTTGTPTAVKLNVTDTASNAASLLMDLQVGGVSKLRVTKGGKLDLYSGTQSMYAYSTGDTMVIAPNNTDVIGFNKFKKVAMPSDAEFGFTNSTSSVTTSPDTKLVRSAAGVMGLRGSSTDGAAFEYIEQTAPSAPAADCVRVYAQDNGAGKTQLMALFSSGAAQQIAIQP